MITKQVWKIGDANVLIRELQDDSIDLVITSPPFNVGIQYGIGFDDKKGIDDYYKFAFQILKEIKRVLKSGGRACIEIGGSGRCFPVSWLWQDSAYKNGLELFSEIIIEHRKTNETAWGSWMKSDNVYTIPNFHLLYVFFNETPTKRGKACDIKREEFIEWTRGRWNILWQPHNGHPASFPIELPYRCMKLFGHVEDVVLDPFLGSGTTLRACRELDRHGIGFEINPTYEGIIRKTVMNDIPSLETWCSGQDVA